MSKNVKITVIVLVVIAIVVSLVLSLRGNEDASTDETPATSDNGQTQATDDDTKIAGANICKESAPTPIVFSLADYTEALPGTEVVGYSDEIEGERQTTTFEDIFNSFTLRLSQLREDEDVIAEFVEGVESWEVTSIIESEAGNIQTGFDQETSTLHFIAPYGGYCFAGSLQDTVNSEVTQESLTGAAINILSGIFAAESPENPGEPESSENPETTNPE